MSQEQTTFCQTCCSPSCLAVNELMKIPVELLLHFQALTGRRRARLSVMDPAGVVAVFLVTAKGQILHERTLSNVEAG